MMNDTIESIAHEEATWTQRPLWYAPAAAVLAATATWLLAVPLAGMELIVQQGDATSEVGPAAVVLAALVGGLGALVVGGATRRWSRRPRRDFVLTTGILACLSLGGPATAATSTSTALWLCSMHLVVAATALPVVAARLPRRGARVEAQE